MTDTAQITGLEKRPCWAVYAYTYSTSVCTSIDGLTNRAAYAHSYSTSVCTSIDGLINRQADRQIRPGET